MSAKVIRGYRYQELYKFYKALSYILIAGPYAQSWLTTLNLQFVLGVINIWEWEWIILNQIDIKRMTTCNEILRVVQLRKWFKLAFKGLGWWTNGNYSWMTALELHFRSNVIIIFEKSVIFDQIFIKKTCSETLTVVQTLKII